LVEDEDRGSGSGLTDLVGTPLLSGLCPSDTRLPLHPEPDQGPGPDGDGADLVGTRVPPRLGAPLPLTGGEHLPATPLVGQLAFRHPASYLTQVHHGKIGGSVTLICLDRVIH
jgi:hypothetical protein